MHDLHNYPDSSSPSKCPHFFGKSLKNKNPNRPLQKHKPNFHRGGNDIHELRPHGLIGSLASSESSMGQSTGLGK